MPSRWLALLCASFLVACSPASKPDTAAGSAGGGASQGGSAGTGGSSAGQGGGGAGQGGGGAGQGGGGAGQGGGAVVSEWRQANLTHFTSYPDPGSEECIEYNGCMWAGYFAALPDQQTEQWVMEHDIAAVHSRDFEMYELKTLRLRKEGAEIDVVVYDMCADEDCSGCCTANSAETGFLIDIEEYTYQRFGYGDGVVEWACIDCD